MALRRKTAYEEWATRYRGGKLAPKESATTISGMPVEPLYTPEDLEGWDYDEKLGYPGEFPYTRGVYPSMYRGQLWTIRQFAGMAFAARDYFDQSAAIPETAAPPDPGSPLFNYLVRRLWDSGGDESPLQVPARARAGGSLGGLRHADLDGV